MTKGLRVFGHPLHAALSHPPMGLLGTALLWDAVGVWRGEAVWWAVSYWSVAAGLAFACVAACAGAVDYAAIEEGDPALATGSRHLSFVLAALLPYVVGMFARGAPEVPRGRAVLAVLLLDGAGSLLLAVGGWYGGHLVFHHRVGSDRPTTGHAGRSEEGEEMFSKEAQEGDVSTDGFIRDGGRRLGA
ncbi:MAG: DUF2231 domain-containing protein [Pyrinomonadaceae bacterium]